jgi:hypothetical protein
MRSEDMENERLVINGWDMVKERKALERRHLPKEVIDDVIETLSWKITDSFGTRLEDFGVAAHTLGKNWYNVIYKSNYLEWNTAVLSGIEIGVFMDKKFGTRRRRDILVKNALNKYALLRLQKGETRDKINYRVPKIPEKMFIV